MCIRDRGKAFFNVNLVAIEGLLFTLIVHAATALSTVVVFRKDIFNILNGLLQFESNQASNFSLKIILSMLPAIVVGLFLEDYINLLFEGNMLLVGSMLLITALILFSADRVSIKKKKISYGIALILGAVQAIAILPGISRSGATVSSAILLGIDREKAARFSFLMVIPLILGSMVKSITDGSLSEENIALFPLMIGFVSAFMTGVFACRWMVALVKKSQLKYFSLSLIHI